MSDGTIILKLPNSSDTIQVTKDMEEYYLKMGYTKVSSTDKKPSFSDKAKFKINKDK